MIARWTRKLALYALQGALWIGVIFLAAAILGGLTYLHDASRHQYEDVRPEVHEIFRTESLLVVLAASCLFGIGSVLTYAARHGELKR